MGRSKRWYRVVSEDRVVLVAETSDPEEARRIQEEAPGLVLLWREERVVTTPWREMGPEGDH